MNIQRDVNVRQLSEAVTRLRRALRNSFRRDSEWVEIPPAQIDLLQLIHEMQPVRSSQLAICSALAPNTVSSMLTSLEKLDVLRREVEIHDRRAYRLSLNEAGESLLASWVLSNEERFEQALLGLEIDEQRRLSKAVEALSALAQQMEIIARENQWP